jgi:short-subunit dehydrogenase
VQVKLLVVCAGYQKLDSLQDLNFEDLDANWKVSQQMQHAVARAFSSIMVNSPEHYGW